METEMLRGELRHLIELYEKRIVRFLELMVETNGDFRSKTDDYGKSLIDIEDALCRHEIRRRDLLLSEASVTAEKILGTGEVNPLYVNRNVVDIGFDESKAFDELRRHSKEEEKKTLSVKKILDPIVGVKVKNEAVERLYGKIRAWASSDYVRELSGINKNRIDEEGSRRKEEFCEKMRLHYMRVMDHYGELLKELPLSVEELKDQIRRIEAAAAEAEVIERSSLELRYTAEAVPCGIRFNCDKVYGKIRFIAVTSPAYIVPMFPYTNEEFSEIFTESFGNYLESDGEYTVSWADSKDGVPLLRYAYPVAEFNSNTVVFPPKYIGDIVASGEGGEVDYTIEDSVLTVRDFCGYGFDDMVFVTDEEYTVANVGEIGEYPSMKAMLCRRDGKTGNFTIPLDSGIHNISLIGMDRDCKVVKSLPRAYIGNRIPVMYSIEVKRSRTAKNSFDLILWLMIEQNSGFEHFAYKKIPGIVIRGGEHAPLTNEQGRLIVETDNIVFTEEKGSYRAKFQTVVSGVDPKYDKLSVFFKEPTNVYQLRKV